jgi:hypothetical protein
MMPHAVKPGVTAAKAVDEPPKRRPGEKSSRSQTQAG